MGLKRTLFLTAFEKWQNRMIYINYIKLEEESLYTCSHVICLKGGKMPHNMTVTVEDPLWEEMKKHNDIRWSAVMKEAVKVRLKALHVLHHLIKSTKLSEESINDFAIELGRKINRGK